MKIVFVIPGQEKTRDFVAQLRKLADETEKAASELVEGLGEPNLMFAPLKVDNVSVECGGEGTGQFIVVSIKKG